MENAPTNRIAQPIPTNLQASNTAVKKSKGWDWQKEWAKDAFYNTKQPGWYDHA